MKAAFKPKLNAAFFANSLVFLIVLVPWINPFVLSPDRDLVSLIASWAFFLISILIKIQFQDREKAVENYIYLCAIAWLAAAIINGTTGYFQYFEATDWSQGWIFKAPKGEISSNLRQSNHFATLLNIGLLSLGWLVQQKIKLKMKISVWQKMLALSIFIFLLGAIFISSSRLGILEFSCLAFIYFLYNKNISIKNKFLILVLLAFSFFAAGVFLSTIKNVDFFENTLFKKFRTEGTYCDNRFILWNNVTYLISQKPWTGWGWSELAYAHFITDYPSQRFCAILTNAHNLPLHLAVTLGIPVSALLLVALSVLVWNARPWKDTDSSRQFAWLVIFILFIHSLLEYPLWYGYFQVMCVISIWILSKNYFISVFSLNAVKIIPTTVCSFGLLLCCHVAWDYNRARQIYLIPSEQMLFYRQDTLEKAKKTVYFSNYVKFAELMISSSNSSTYPEKISKDHALALDLLHFSPEPRVLVVVVESTFALGLQDQFKFYSSRFKTVQPVQYHAWLKNWQPRHP